MDNEEHLIPEEPETSHLNSNTSPIRTLNGIQPMSSLPTGRPKQVYRIGSRDLLDLNEDMFWQETAVFELGASYQSVANYPPVNENLLGNSWDNRSFLETYRTANEVSMQIFYGTFGLGNNNPAQWRFSVWRRLRRADVISPWVQMPDGINPNTVEGMQAFFTQIEAHSDDIQQLQDNLNEAFNLIQSSGSGGTGDVPRAEFNNHINDVLIHYGSGQTVPTGTNIDEMLTEGYYSLNVNPQTYTGTFPLGAPLVNHRYTLDVRLIIGQSNQARMQVLYEQQTNNQAAAATPRQWLRARRGTNGWSDWVETTAQEASIPSFVPRFNLSVNQMTFVEFETLTNLNFNNFLTPGSYSIVFAQNEYSSVANAPPIAEIKGTIRFWINVIAGRTLSFRQEVYVASGAANQPQFRFSRYRDSGAAAWTAWQREFDSRLTVDTIRDDLRDKSQKLILLETAAKQLSIEDQVFRDKINELRYSIDAIRYKIGGEEEQAPEVLKRWTRRMHTVFHSDGSITTEVL